MVQRREWVQSLSPICLSLSPPWEILDLLGHLNQVLQNLRRLREDRL